MAALIIRPPGDPFVVEPYTAGELRFHVFGALLNSTLLAIAAAFLFLHPPGWTWGTLAVLLGIFLADLVSGLLHWAFDTWFEVDHPVLRRMVLQVREHHVYRHRIFAIAFTHDAGTLSWIALLLCTPPLMIAILFAPSSTLAAAVVLVSTVFNLLLVCMLEFHKCGHRRRNPPWVRALQAIWLVLPITHHLNHHRGNHDFNYCLINGWADLTLGRLGLFRWLERRITRLSGMQPRCDDLVWRQRYQAKRVGRSTA